MREIPAVATSFIKERESLVLRVYDDQRPDKILQSGDAVLGRLTGGYGHTGSDVHIGMEVTQAIADQWLDNDEDRAGNEFADVVHQDVIDMLTDNQYAAMISFVLNLGANPDWTIWKRLNAKQFDQVPLEMAKFVNEHRGSEVVKVSGLVNRRAAEVVLWSTGEPGSVTETPPSSVTRAAITPPTSSDPQPPSRSKMLIAGAASAVAGVPPAVSQVSDAIQPYADKSHYVHLVIGGLATIAAICAGATLVFMWLHKRDARN